jgi:hypothetical protein
MHVWRGLHAARWIEVPNVTLHAAELRPPLSPFGALCLDSFARVGVSGFSGHGAGSGTKPTILSKCLVQREGGLSYLSGGEKAAFDLLLDLVIKRREFNDTVFFIDEPEAHMSPAQLRADCDYYSNRSILTGSTRAARRAGIQQAPSDTSNNSPATVEMISGSFAEIP